MKKNNYLNRCLESYSRQIAKGTSRRSFLARLGSVMVGIAGIPLLPVARAATGSDSNLDADPGDPKNCDYWRYCAIDGYLCSCCGGSVTACPPGTEMSAITWIGTCRNPADNKNYIISYNDCCGSAACARCFCNRNEGDMPTYMPFRSNDINWCLGEAYNCSTAIILGVAEN